MKIVGIIPARYTSSRLPGKPLADICGKPMVWWVYQRAKQVAKLDDVIVATDDVKIVEACEKLNIKAMMTSASHKTGTDRAGEVARAVKADIYVIIQGDEPLIESKSIEKVISPLISDPSLQVTSLMVKIKDPVDVINTTTAKVVTSKTGKCLLISRSPIPYPKDKIDIDYFNGVGVYGMKADALEFFCSSQKGKIESIEDSELLRFIDNDIEVRFIAVNTKAISVDTPKDLARVAKIISRNVGHA